MGRSKRVRETKKQNRFVNPIRLDSSPIFVDLLKALQQRSSILTSQTNTTQLSKLRISPALFPILNGSDPEPTSYYRGICSNQKSINSGEIILKIPQRLLIRSEDFPQIISEIKTSLQNKFTIYLLLEGSRDPAVQESKIQPYLNTLPTNFLEHPAYLSTSTTTCLPNYYKNILEVQRGKILKGFTALEYFIKENRGHGFLTGIEDMTKVLDINRFRYYWLAVYTRSVFFDDGESEIEKIDRVDDQMALAPFLDLLNHSPEPNTVTLFEDEAYVIQAVKPIRKFEQIFISYGNHPNSLLWTDYGFIPPSHIHNPHNFLPISFNDLLHVPVFSDCGRNKNSVNGLFNPLIADQRKHKVVEKFTLSKELSLLENEFSPNLSLLVALLQWNSDLIKRFDFNVNFESNDQSRHIARSIVQSEIKSYMCSLKLLSESKMNTNNTIVEGSISTERIQIPLALETAINFFESSILFLEKLLMEFSPCC